MVRNYVGVAANGNDRADTDDTSRVSVFDWAVQMTSAQGSRVSGGKTLALVFYLSNLNLRTHYKLITINYNNQSAFSSCIPTVILMQVLFVIVRYPDR